MITWKDTFLGKRNKDSPCHDHMAAFLGKIDKKKKRKSSRKLMTISGRKVELE